MCTVITSDELKQNVKANLSRLLAERGWTVNQLADKLSGHVGRNTVFRISRGENLGNLEVLYAIADIMDLGSIEELTLRHPQQRERQPA